MRPKTLRYARRSYWESRRMRLEVLYGPQVKSHTPEPDPSQKTTLRAHNGTIGETASGRGGR